MPICGIIIISANCGACCKNSRQQIPQLRVERRKTMTRKKKRFINLRALTLIVICLSIALSLMVMPAEAKNKKKANDEIRVVVVTQSQARVQPSQVPKRFKHEAKKSIRIWRYTVFENKKAVATYYSFEKRNGIVWLPDQYLEIEGSIGPRGFFLVGPETLEPEFDKKFGVSMALTPAGSEGAEVPGRGFRDPFFFKKGYVGFHRCVESMKYVGNRKYKISYRFSKYQALKLRKTHRKYHGHRIYRLSYWR